MARRVSRPRKPSRRPSANAGAAFPDLSRAMFAASYPEGAHKLRHNLLVHPLLDLDALTQLAEALEAGGPGSVEYHAGDRQPGTGGRTIRELDEGNSWAALRNVGQVPSYAALIDALLGELEAEIVAKTGRTRRTQGHVYVCSPEAAIDRGSTSEHSILMQLVGETTLTVFPAEPSFQAPGGALGRGTAGWRENLAEHGVSFKLEPGDAAYLPVGARRRIRIGALPSISLALAWRSEWSYAEEDARAFNALLRAWGFDPMPPERWPARNRTKSIAWRTLRRLPGIN
jgi:hypothetical protein